MLPALSHFGRHQTVNIRKLREEFWSHGNCCHGNEWLHHFRVDGENRAPAEKKKARQRRHLLAPRAARCSRNPASPTARPSNARPCGNSSSTPHSAVDRTVTDIRLPRPCCWWLVLMAVCRTEWPYRQACWSLLSEQWNFLRTTSSWTD